MRIPLLLAFLLLTSTAKSQQHPRYGGAPTRQELYATDARALPRLYEKKDFDSIAYYIQLRWREPTDPDVLCQAILLSIQRNIFDHPEFPDLNSLTGPTINLLRAYANLLAARQDSRCHLPEIDKQLFFTLSRWAYDLLRTRSNDSVENFFLRVYSGDIRYPEEYLSLHAVAPATTPAPEPRGMVYYGLYGPHKVGGVLTFSSGIWAPNGHLSLLGADPSINFGLGVRNALNEWDFDIALRFVFTPSPYTFLHNDTLISRKFYDGGNTSVNYTHYLIHQPRWEAGLSTGVGIDFIDFTSGTGTDNWSEIQCFDFNLGFRWNYHFSPRGFVGLVARYHFLGYSNPSGNVATIDIIIGLAGVYKR
jgi:hypothetical protein